MERRHEIARTLDSKQQYLFHQTGAHVQSLLATRLGFLPDANYCHDVALAALESTNWKSLKAAKAMLQCMSY